MTGRPTMIFHAAYRLDPQAKSASGIRPQRMLRAFTDLGYEVLEVSGTHAERRDRIRDLTERIAEGLRVDFVYSEASTQPTGLGEPVTRATSLRRDLSFLIGCQRAGIPVGVFYRDIYWRFPIYAQLIGRFRAAIMRQFYRADLRRYRRGGLTVFLPSERMGEWVPIVPADRFVPLPPGAEIRDAKPSTPTATDAGAAPDDAAPLEVLYVGGLGKNYQLHETARAFTRVEHARLTICTREADWAAAAAEYGEFVGDRVRVVHRSGEELRELYAAADVCVLAVKPIVYWDFASPMKLYEYLGYGKPVLASEGTLAGRVVESEGIGWTVPYREDALRAVLERLSADRGEVERCAVRAREVRAEHSWEARARQAAVALTGSDPLATSGEREAS
ncbi:hypothetical protein K8P10_000374 [Leucobacter sp. Psy1]|uniref:glycosyltransferase family 4 protein n=1 Tax=Leucobacter sp. Psy1 TaxID=2875729 RepID=UPI001CD3C59A|nr:glycosyltransferase family 4 protein [Leucobacter sp. Psy1]UBH04863.1 hypothetical protein K8P10_000374 [Leucobacter sp. Psy1]